MTKEIRTTAFSNGRRLTLDPVRKTDLSIEVREVENSLPVGLRMGWAQGKTAGGKKFDVSTGAGVGGEWLIFDIEEGPLNRSYLINLNDILKAVLTFDEQVV